MIKGQNSAEQVVTVSPTTTIRFMHNLASTSDLVPGNQVIVIGEPESNGSINASFIRVIPPPGAPSGLAPSGRQSGQATSTANNQ